MRRRRRRAGTMKFVSLMLQQARIPMNFSQLPVANLLTGSQLAS